MSRLRGLGPKHLMKVGSSSQSQFGEVLAITMLNNASLSKEPLTNAKLCLIGIAEERDKGFILSEKKFSYTMKDPQKISLSTKKVAVSIGRVSGISSRNDNLSLMKVTSRFNTMCRDVKPIFDNIEKLIGTQDVAKSIASYDPRCILSLDDAVIALRSLAQTINRNESPISRGSF